MASVTLGQCCFIHIAQAPAVTVKRQGTVGQSITQLSRFDGTVVSRETITACPKDGIKLLIKRHHRVLQQLEALWRCWEGTQCEPTKVMQVWRPYL